MNGSRLPRTRARLVIRPAVVLVVATSAAVAGPAAAQGQQVACLNLTPTVIGTENDDTLVGTNARDVIIGLGGNDTIRGLGGPDVICGDYGDSNVRPRPGRDTIYAGPSGAVVTDVDQVRGEERGDTIRGEDGRDELEGGFGGTRCTAVPATTT